MSLIIYTSNDCSACKMMKNMGILTDDYNVVNVDVNPELKPKDLSSVPSYYYDGKKIGDGFRAKEQLEAMKK